MPESAAGPTRSPGGADRRGFGVTVLVGLGAGVLAAVGGDRAWADVDTDTSAAGSIASVTASIDQASAPLVTSLALVVLAAWGVLLVTRGRFRRVVAWLGLVAGVGLVVAAVGAWVEAPQQVRDAVGDDSFAVHHTAWSFVATVATVLALASLVVAVRRVRGWPEMGRRYDAPAVAGEAVPAPSAPIEEQSNLDLWRAIDEGRDPTDRADP